MKLKDLKNLLESASDDTEIKIDNGEIVITELKPIEYKFKVGDKVTNSYPQDAIYEIVELKECNGEPLYKLKLNDAVFTAHERYIKLVLQDITERIKTFYDAVDWCNENGYDVYTSAYNVCVDDMGNDDRVKDIISYLKLRIITVALNEGWKPMEEDSRYVPAYTNDGRYNAIEFSASYFGDSSSKLCFKSEELAKYAAKQFRDIYADFCGVKKENNN